MPDEQLRTDLLGIDHIARRYEAATTAGDPESQAEAFYTLDGVARQLAASADTARAEASDALGLAAEAEAERDLALSLAHESAPRDPAIDQELQTLREQVATLTGSLATAQDALRAEKLAHGRTRELLSQELHEQMAISSARQRRLLRAQGRLAAGGEHVCHPEDVPHMRAVGVVGGLRVWVQNSAPRQQHVVFLTHQRKDGAQLTITIADRVTRQQQLDTAQGEEDRPAFSQVVIPAEEAQPSLPSGTTGAAKEAGQQP